METPDIRARHRRVSANRLTSIAECLAGFVLVLLTGRGLRVLLPDLWDWQQQTFGRPLLTNLFVLIVLPLALLGLTRRDPGRYGIAFDRLNYHLELGLTSLVILGPVAGLAFPLLAWRGTAVSSLEGGMILTAAYLVSVPLVALLLRSHPQAAEPSACDWRRIAAFMLLLVALTVLLALTLPATRLVLAVAYPLLFVGFGEELLFRGYLQSRLNVDLGRPFMFFGTPWGWGLVLAAALFGMAHTVGPAEPVRPWYGVWTFAAGLVYGFLREKTGGIVAPSIAHGVPEVVPYLLFGELHVPLIIGHALWDFLGIGVLAGVVPLLLARG
jgi:membrane protease YdiL (CAAX protease family)